MADRELLERVEGHMRGEIGDSRKQVQANTRAVLAVLDELRGGGPGPSNAAA